MNDENMSDDDRENPSDNIKRLKTDSGTEERTEERSERSEENSTSSNNNEQETASTSTSSDSGFFRRRAGNRNYRPRFRDFTIWGTDDEEDSAMVEDGYTTTNNSVSLSPGSSDATLMLASDSESEDEDCPILHKPKPKQNWFVLPELMNRQMGYSAKYKSPELFQTRCYGSLRSVRRLELMYKLEEHEGCVNSVNFHPDGSLLASGSDDLNVCIWDWQIGKCKLKYHSKHRNNVFQTKFMHLNGDLHIVTCARDGQVRVAQVSREEGIRSNRKLGVHRGPCHKVAVLADEPQVILSAGEDGIVFSHDLRKNKPDKLVHVKNYDKEVALYSIHNHPLKTQEYCVAGRQQTVQIYDRRKNDEPVRSYCPFPKNSTLHVTCAVYNHDGSEVLASYSEGDIYLFDESMTPGMFLHQYQGHRNSATIKGVNFFGRKSEYVVSGSDCGNIYFWDKNTEAIVQWMPGDNNGVVNCIEPHPQVPFLCTSGLDWDIKVWVPSCENDPEMKDLAKIVKNNMKLKKNLSLLNDVDETRMLYMLWRHLQNRNIEIGGRNLIFGTNFETISDSSLSSSSNSSESNETNELSETDDEEDWNAARGCSTS